MRSIVRWWRQRQFLRELDKEGFAVGAGPCEGPTSKPEGKGEKYLLFAVPASRWFVADSDCYFGKTMAQEAARISLARHALKRLAATSDPDEIRQALADLDERQIRHGLMWVSAAIVTDQGGHLIYEAASAPRCEVPSDARHAFWSGRRGFFPLRLVNKSGGQPRQMYALHPVAEELAAAFNSSASTASRVSQRVIDWTPFLDAAWRER